MSLIKKNIHMNKVKGKIISQVTMDDDVNVPDRLPDIGNKITETGNILVDSVKVMQNKISVKGKMKFKMMYRAQGQPGEIHKLDGDMDFDEIINMDGIEDGDNISVDLLIEDLSINVVNSRKISVKAIVTVVVLAENMCDEEVGVDIEDEDIEYIKDSVKLTQIAMRKKDLLRIKEEISLGTGKLNINEIIWNTASLYNEQSKMVDEKVILSGEIKLFVLYNSDDGPLQWMDATIPFNGTVDMPGCDEDMIPRVEMKLSNIDIEARPDYDGEQRMIMIDGIVNVDIKLYEEQEFDIVKDAYSRKKEVILDKKEVECENLLIKNITKCKVSERLKAKGLEGFSIMQICNCSCEIKIDDINLADEGLVAEGVLEVWILYVCSDDTNPLCCLKGNLPFSQKIDVNGIDKNSIYNIRGTLENLSTTMAGGDEIEVKAAILLDCVVFEKNKKSVITDMNEQEYDMEMLNELPGIVCYIVKEGDTKWSIATEFYTTIETINTINDLKGDELKVGEMLVLVKK